jgi:hypothetical protein
VHTEASTVCICLCAPRMASTGHGGRHFGAAEWSRRSPRPAPPSVLPTGFSGTTARLRSAKLRDGGGDTRRTLIDAGGTRDDGPA